MQQSTLFQEQGTNKSCTLFPHLYPVPETVYPVPRGHANWHLFPKECTWKWSYMGIKRGTAVSIWDGHNKCMHSKV